MSHIVRDSSTPNVHVCILSLYATDTVLCYLRFTLPPLQSKQELSSQRTCSTCGLLWVWVLSCFSVVSLSSSPGSSSPSSGSTRGWSATTSSDHPSAVINTLSTTEHSLREARPTSPPLPSGPPVSHIYQISYPDPHLHSIAKLHFLTSSRLISSDSKAYFSLQSPWHGNCYLSWICVGYWLLCRNVGCIAVSNGFFLYVCVVQEDWPLNQWRDALVLILVRRSPTLWHSQTIQSERRMSTWSRRRKARLRAAILELLPPDMPVQVSHSQPLLPYVSPFYMSFISPYPPPMPFRLSYSHYMPPSTLYPNISSYLIYRSLHLHPLFHHLSTYLLYQSIPLSLSPILPLISHPVHPIPLVSALTLCNSRPTIPSPV